ncbi:MAG: hypothetical protein LAT51_13680 [Flavobacteriaceae bacterium]|nr:hypothetical protein [Flavobacteriaceae bacterium]
MKKSNNIITDWLDKYGNPEIERQVEKEIEYINKIEMLKSKIKEYCKTHKMKFKKYIDGGFVASKLVDVKAGMEYKPGTDRLISIPIKKIGSKRVYRKFICYSDGDIVDVGIIQNYC